MLTTRAVGSARRVVSSLLALAACDGSGGGEPAEVCHDVDCVRAPAAACQADLRGRSVSPTTGACGGADGLSCEYPAAVDEACGASDEVCILGACVAVSSLCYWEYGERISIQSGVRVGNQASESDPGTGQPVDACCKDFDDDGTIDNALGSVLANLKEALVDINPYFEGQIKGGNFNILYDFRGVDDLVDDPHFELLGYEAFPEPEDDDPDPTQSGHGLFRVKQRSWIAGTVVPRIHAFGRIEAGRMILDEGVWSFFFATAEGGDVVALPFESFRFEGSVALGPDGSGLVIHATLHGLIKPADLFLTLSNEVDFSCLGCATYAEGAHAMDADGVCTKPDSTTCTDAFCSAMTTDFCTTIPVLFAPDVDSDGDGVHDRISAGLFIDTTSAGVSRLEANCIDGEL